VLPEFFDDNPTKEMFEIAEKFIPEYSNVLLAIVGSTYLASNCNFEETSNMSKFLL